MLHSPPGFRVKFSERLGLRHRHSHLPAIQGQQVDHQIDEKISFHLCCQERKHQDCVDGIVGQPRLGGRVPLDGRNPFFIRNLNLLPGRNPFYFCQIAILFYFCQVAILFYWQFNFFARLQSFFILTFYSGQAAIFFIHCFLFLLGCNP